MIELSNGSLRLKISEVGAALAELWLVDTQIVGHPDQYSGVILYPWPNRISDGIWQWQGQSLELPINDVDGCSSLHGLVFDKEFSAVDLTPNSVELQFDLPATSGFPFKSRVSATYKISQTLVEVRIAITNLEQAGLPFAIGIHPYFVADENSTVTFETTQLAVSSIHLDDSFANPTESIKVETEEFVVAIQSIGLPISHVFTNRYSSEDVLWLAVESQSAVKDSLKHSETTLVLEALSTQEFVYSLMPTLKA